MVVGASVSDLMLYLDMDETLVDFSGAGGLVNALRNMRQRGFYHNLYPKLGAWRFVQWLRERGFKFKVISGVIDTPFVCPEKLWWCENYLDVSPSDVIFVPKDERKVDYVGDVTECDVLVDDYRRYVEEWRGEGGSAFLFSEDGGEDMGCVKSFDELKKMLTFITEGSVWW